MGDVGMWFVRGDLTPAVSVLHDVVSQLDQADPAFAEIAAHLVLMTFLADSASDTWTRVANGAVNVDSGALRIVSSSIESDRHWHAGDLFTGLRLSQSAMQYSQDQSPVWMILARIFLTKKLTDLHVSQQARSVIDETKRLIDIAGMQAFEPVVAGLTSLLHLQQGRHHDALEAAATAVSISDQCHGTVGLKVALSVAAAAHLRLGDRHRAMEALDAYDEARTGFVLFDSIVRNAATRIGLVDDVEGPHAAAQRIRESWDELGSTSGCFVEDPDRPAWLIGIARRAGDVELVERCLDAITRLARRNPGAAVLERAVDRAGAAFRGDEAPGPAPGPPTSRSGRRARAAPEDGPSPPGVPDLSLLSTRELEVARLVGRGMTNRQVASTLKISTHTVNFHLRGVYRKLSIATRVKLASLTAIPDPPESGPER